MTSDQPSKINAMPTSVPTAQAPDIGQSSLRVSVFLQWVWTYLTGQRGSRLIVNHRASEPSPAVADAARSAIASSA